MSFQILDDHPQYAISISGDVMNLRTSRIKKPYLDRKGYWRVSLYVDGKQYNRLVHRLLAKTYIDNPLNLPFINHKNGVRSDNKLSNLEWCTAAENVQDGFNRGRQTWNKDMKSTANMDLEDLARELPRLQELAKALWGDSWKEDCKKCGFTHYMYDKDQYDDEQADPYIYHLMQMMITDDPIKYLKENT